MHVCVFVRIFTDIHIKKQGKKDRDKTQEVRVRVLMVRVVVVGGAQ